MAQFWVVVASSSEAKIYSSGNLLAQLSVVHEMSCEEARLHEQDFNSDRAGRAFDSFGKGRHETNPPSSSKQHVVEQFAREISKYLDKARTDNKFKQLILIAEPHFLGVLGGVLGTELDKMIDRKISKNLTKQSVQTIRDNLIH